MMIPESGRNFTLTWIVERRGMRLQTHCRNIAKLDRRLIEAASEFKQEVTSKKEEERAGLVRHSIQTRSFPNSLVATHCDVSQRTQWRLTTEGRT